MYKLVFYAPLGEVESIKTSIFETGAGSIGQYSHCSWETAGMGQFKPLEGANPTLGSVKELEKVDELKVEILCEESNIRDAIEALKMSHSYEEPVYEVISIENHRFL